MAGPAHDQRDRRGGQARRPRGRREGRADRLGGAVHPELAFRLSELAGVDASNFDRVMTFDPLSAAAAQAHVPVWRSLPLPVDDVVYAAPRALGSPPRVVFLGYSTQHREQWLI